MEGHGGDRDVEEREAFPHENHQPPKQPPDVGGFRWELCGGYGHRAFIHPPTHI